MLAITKARIDFKTHPSSVIGWVVVASSLYYHRYYSLFQDEEYDKMCQYVLKHYDNLEHKLKYLITKEDMAAGTLYAVSVDKYPDGLVWLADGIARDQELYLNKEGVNEDKSI